jgi:uncharacterized protein with GYD domain
VANYILLLNWTEKGVSSAKETVQRGEQVRQMAQQMGCDLKTTYWTLGRYDSIALLEAPDDEAATAFALRASAMGTVRTETLRAFTADEMSAILSRAG